jgi:hypothetical protein
MKTLLLASTWFLLAVCNWLAQTNATIPPAGSPATNLPNFIASADHIVITNRLANLDTRYRRFSLSISGGRVSKIVEAVSAARCHEMRSDSEYDWEVQFFRATNRLAVIDLQCGMFWAENKEYYDGTGVLEKLYREILDRTEPLEYR